MNKHFLTFGDTRRYSASLARMEQEVAAMAYFDSARICSENDIAELVAAHPEFFATSNKGYGFWTWKSFLVGKYLEAMSEGDVLLFCDVGCQFNVNPASMQRLDEYFEWLGMSRHATLSFELTHQEKTWTKRDCFDFFGIEVDESMQLVGGVFLIRKCPAAVALIAGINALVAERRYHLFDDSPSVAPNDPSFIEHRHDQSVFSLLRKREGTLIFPDETWFEDWTDGRDFPIHARRFR